MAKQEYLKSVVMYDSRRNEIKAELLPEALIINSENYKKLAKKELLIFAWQNFEDSITEIRFPDLLKGEFPYCYVTTKEDDQYEQFEISLGV